MSSERPMHVKMQIERMVRDIKKMEPILGKSRVEEFAKNTLRNQVEKGTISEEEYAELMSKLGYE